MPTRCKHDIYCRFYCLLNMFRAPLCPSSGAREYYADGRCLWYLVLWFSSCRYGVELRVMVPETCWASNKICNKYHLLHPVGILFPHIKDDARSESLQIVRYNYFPEIWKLLVQWVADIQYIARNLPRPAFTKGQTLEIRQSPRWKFPTSKWFR